MSDLGGTEPVVPKGAGSADQATRDAGSTGAHIDKEYRQLGEADLAALDLMTAYHSAELPRVQARADKWIGGLTAISGLLGTVIVVKGTDTFGDLVAKRKLWGQTWDTQWTLIALMGLGAFAFVVSIFLAYSAANGGPLHGTAADDAVKGQWRPGDHDGQSAAAYWIGQVGKAVHRSRLKLFSALIATLLGLVLIGGALVFAWTTPSMSSGSPVCISTATGVIQVSDIPTIKSGKVELSAC